MEGNDHEGDFDDFFDTPGRRSQEISEHELINKKVSSRNSPASSPPRAASKKPDRNSSRSVNRRSMSSDSRSSRSYSSDSQSHSDTGSTSRNTRRKSRSRSASSRSAGSHSSRETPSYRKDRRDCRSPSSDSSRSRSSSTELHRRGHRSNQRDKRRESSSSITLTSQSEDEKSGKQTTSPRPPNRQAWTADGGDRVASRRLQERPKTAKRRTGNGGEERTKHTNHRNHHLPVESDSDMTDVSPISSPRNGHVNGHKRGSTSSGARHNGSQQRFAAMPLEEETQRKVLDGGDSNALDLNILMKAVSELEKQNRVKANTRRVMFEPTRPRKMEKSNYTFSNNDAHRIETENKRLLREIVRQMHTNERKQTAKVPTLKVHQTTLTASAVNRRREQKRIENENLAFLRRLQKIKPTKGLARRDQLHSYDSTVLHGVPIATLHPAPSRAGSRSGRGSSASSVAGSLGGRTRSMSSIHSSVTASSVGTASRISSRASSRPSSAKKNVTERPPWNDRWWQD